MSLVQTRGQCWSGVLRTKAINAEHHLVDTGLRRVLGPVDLTLLGIGAIIGAGIFAFTGMAAAIGGRGVMGGAALIFLAYLGFDAISTAAEEIAVAWAMSFACALGGNSETSREPVITTMA